MDRPTKEFETANGHKVVMFEYVTGAEARAIKAVHQKPSDGKAADDAAHDHALKMVVVSLDGSSDNIVERILDLPLVDFAKITAVLTDLLDPKKN